MTCRTHVDFLTNFLEESYVAKLSQRRSNLVSRFRGVDAYRSFRSRADYADTLSGPTAYNIVSQSVSRSVTYY